MIRIFLHLPRIAELVITSRDFSAVNSALSPSNLIKWVKYWHDTKEATVIHPALLWQVIPGMTQFGTIPVTTC